MLGNRKLVRWCQIRGIWRVITKFKATQARIAAIATTDLSLWNRTYTSSVFQAVSTWLVSQLPQQVRIVFPNDSLDFLKVVNEHNHALCSPEDGGHHLSCRWHQLGLLWTLEGGGGGVGVFRLHALSSGLELEVVDPTLILCEETFKTTGWICFKKGYFRLRHGQHGVLLIRHKKLWHPPDGHATFVVQNLLYSFLGDAYIISYVFLSGGFGMNVLWGYFLEIFDYTTVWRW